MRYYDNINKQGTKVNFFGTMCEDTRCGVWEDVVTKSVSTVDNYVTASIDIRGLAGFHWFHSQFFP